MEAINITKSDIKSLLAMSSVIPVLCFISGFYFANNQSQVDTQQTATEKPIVQIETSKLETAPVSMESTHAIQPEDQTNVEASTVAISTQSELKEAEIAKRFIVQAGLFSNIDNAKKLSHTLSTKKLEAHIMDDFRNGNPIYRVIIGSFESEENAKVFLHDTEQSHAIRLYLTTSNSNKNAHFVAAL